jgi:hypothetical protein
VRLGAHLGLRHKDADSRIITLKRSKPSVVGRLLPLQGQPRATVRSLQCPTGVIGVHQGLHVCIVMNYNYKHGVGFSRACMEY